MTRLAALARHPRRVLGITALLFAIAVVVGSQVFGVLKSGNDFEDPASQGVQTRGLLERTAGQQVGVGLVALVRTHAQVATSPTASARVQAIARTIADDPAVASVVGFYNSHQPAFLSHDGRSTYVAATFRDLSDQQVQDAGTRLQTRLDKLPGVLVGGPALSGPAIGKQVGMDIGIAEGLAFPILFLLSLRLPVRSPDPGVVSVQAGRGDRGGGQERRSVRDLAPWQAGAWTERCRVPARRSRAGIDGLLPPPRRA
jgi:hypothetical protein